MVRSTFISARENSLKRALGILLLALVARGVLCNAESKSLMLFSDTSRIGVSFAKDPSVVKYQHQYFLYYSLPPKVNANEEDLSEKELTGWGIGIAKSADLKAWLKVGEVHAIQPAEDGSIAAPKAKVIHGIVHLFYQRYGKSTVAAVCHGWSSDGIQAYASRNVHTARVPSSSQGNRRSNLKAIFHR